MNVLPNPKTDAFKWYNMLQFGISADGRVQIKPLAPPFRPTQAIVDACLAWLDRVETEYLKLCITNSHPFAQDFPGWFPYKTENVKEFTRFKELFDKGSLAVFTYAQQYDLGGNKVTPAGIVYGHAFSICDWLEDGDHRLVRIQNPWNGGSEPDWSPYADGATFWSDRPHLASKLQASA